MNTNSRGDRSCVRTDRFSCMITKLRMPLLQMFNIHEALSAVKEASELDLAVITALLEKGFTLTHPADGLFQLLDVAHLNLNAKQKTIVQVAQGK